MAVNNTQPMAVNSSLLELLCIVYSHGCCVLFAAKPAAAPQCQSSCQIAATPLVGQQIQRPALSAALAVATCEASACNGHAARGTGHGLATAGPACSDPNTDLLWPWNSLTGCFLPLA
jgi:hypothetical protein